MFYKGPRFKKLEFTGNIDKDVILDLSKKSFILSIIKMILSFILVFFGIWLIYIGIESDATLKIVYNNFIFESNKAYPGSILAFLGFILAFFSKMNIKISK